MEEILKPLIDALGPTLGYVSENGMVKPEYNNLVVMYTFIFLGFTVLFVYLYSAITLQKIAKNLNNRSSWLAWIPYANFFLLWQLSETKNWTLVVFLITIFLGYVTPLLFVSTAIGIYWLWQISVKLNKPGWISLLTLIPILGLIIPGILAWSKTDIQTTQTP